MLDWKKEAVLGRFVLVAIVLLFAQLHCAMACAVQTCQIDAAQSGHVPPCHRHRLPSQTKAHGSCSPQNAIAPTVSPWLVQSDMPVSGMIAAEFDLANALACVHAGAIDRSASSPPGPASASCVVLRI